MRQDVRHSVDLRKLVNQPEGEPAHSCNGATAPCMVGDVVQQK